MRVLGNTPPPPIGNKAFPMKLWKRGTLRTLFRVACGPSPCHSVSPCDVVEVGGMELGRIPRGVMSAGRLAVRCGRDVTPLPQARDRWMMRDGMGGWKERLFAGDKWIGD